MLVGSRGLGVEHPQSDYDYLEIDNNTERVANIHIDKHSHCYHMNENYIDRLMKLETEPEDYLFIYRPEYYRAGATKVNPFDYKDKWIEYLKNMDFHYKYFYAPHLGIFTKRFYHIVFNLECLKQNTLYPTMERVKRFHDRAAEQSEYLDIIKEIQEL